MTTLLLVVVAIAVGFTALSFRNKRRGPETKTVVQEASTSAPPNNQDKGVVVPSVYTVRGNKRWLLWRSIGPRLFMWGVITGTTVVGLALVNPHAIIDTIVTFGPSALMLLVGFAVLGYGYRLEEEHESYEYSRLGWGGAIVLWIIALVLLR